MTPPRIDHRHSAHPAAMGARSSAWLCVLALGGTPACTSEDPATGLGDQGTPDDDSHAGAGGSGGEAGAGGSGGSGGENSTPAEPTEKQQDQIALVAEYLELTRHHTAWIEDFDVDDEAVLARATSIIVEGDESDWYLHRAMREALLAWPVGHHGLYAQATCSEPQTEIYWLSASRLGVCARPWNDSFVITHARSGNALGLSAGDIVTSVGGLVGDAMYEEVLRWPACGASSATPSHARIAAATSLFTSIPVGTTLSVDYVGGESGDVEIPAGDVSYLDCRSPMGGNLAVNADSYRRADGIAVITVPRFMPLNADPGGTDFEEDRAEIRAALLDAFNAVSDAPGIVWDLRANSGGISTVGFEIVAGMPSARPEFVAHCGTRIAGLEPVRLAMGTEFDYRVPETSEFSYSGKTAVLTDGLCASAGDYFVRAVQLATDVPVVGTPTTGAFGGVGALQELGTGPTFSVYLDPFRCSDESGDAIEGKVLPVDVAVEMVPVDMAAGIDTQLEAAVELVLP